MYKAMSTVYYPDGRKREDIFFGNTVEEIAGDLIKSMTEHVAKEDGDSGKMEVNVVFEKI